MKRFGLILVMVTLTLSSIFCQTPKVWTETRGDSVVYVMTEQQAKEIASKIIDLRASSDSIDVLLQTIDQYTLINKNLQAELIITKDRNSKCDEVVVLQQSQIDNHIKIESELNDQITSHKRRKWLYGGGGMLIGLILGSLW